MRPLYTDHLLAHTWRLWLAIGLGPLACAEPVDCQLEPQRCPNVRVQPLAAAALPARPSVAERPPAVQVPSAQVPLRAGQRQLQVPLNPGNLGQPPTREPLALNIRPKPLAAETPAPLPVGAPSREDLKALVVAVQLPASTKDFEALRPFITPRLYASLAPLMAESGDRLWRHLAKYKQAGSSGFETKIESVELDKVHAALQLPDGSELRPILEKQNGVWKIDRF